MAVFQEKISIAVSINICNWVLEKKWSGLIIVAGKPDMNDSNIAFCSLESTGQEDDAAGSEFKMHSDWLLHQKI